MKTLREFIETSQLAEDILSTAFQDEQIDAAEYFDVREMADGNFRLCIYDKDGIELGKMDSSDVDSLFSYVEEVFEVDADDIEIEMLQATQ